MVEEKNRRKKNNIMVVIVVVMVVILVGRLTLLWITFSDSVYHRTNVTGVVSINPVAVDATVATTTAFRSCCSIRHNTTTE
mmetsp:Transcript_12463/g.14204  ORF Transcript_12463/g.14204 Transcript_12463/m.14204 type:complete len:81 (-) Transcript_12463:17-259(-)